jgi:hypothetical protein
MGQAGVDPAWPLYVLVRQAHTYKGAIPVEKLMTNELRRKVLNK